VEGSLRYQSGSWQLGDVDLVEHLDRDQRLMLVFVPLGETEPVICGICGFVMNEVQEYPRCKLMLEDAARALERERGQLFGDIEDYLERGEE
jgi:hypothetical protein